MEFCLNKFYRTRDGRKAQIFMLDNGAGMMLGAVLIDRHWLSRNWKSNGETTGNCDRDLVSEWREPSLKAEKVISLHGARAGVEVLNFLHDTLDGVLTSGYIKVTVEEIADTANS